VFSWEAFSSPVFSFSSSSRFISINTPPPPHTPPPTPQTTPPPTNPIRLDVLFTLAHRCPCSFFWLSLLPIWGVSFSFSALCFCVVSRAGALFPDPKSPVLSLNNFPFSQVAELLVPLWSWQAGSPRFKEVVSLGPVTFPCPGRNHGPPLFFFCLPCAMPWQIGFPFLESSWASSYP